MSEFEEVCGKIVDILPGVGFPVGVNNVVHVTWGTVVVSVIYEAFVETPDVQTAVLIRMKDSIQAMSVHELKAHTLALALEGVVNPEDVGNVRSMEDIPGLRNSVEMKLISKTLSGPIITAYVLHSDILYIDKETYVRWEALNGG